MGIRVAEGKVRIETEIRFGIRMIYISFGSSKAVEMEVLASQRGGLVTADYDDKGLMVGLEILLGEKGS